MLLCGSGIIFWIGSLDGAVLYLCEWYIYKDYKEVCNERIALHDDGRRNSGLRGGYRSRMDFSDVVLDI